MEKENKITLIRIIISAVLFALSFFKFMGTAGTITLSVIAFVIAAYDVVFKSIIGIFKGNFFDEKLLMTVASVGAFAILKFHEAVAVMLFYQLGELLQDLAVDHSKNSIKKLMDIRPNSANLVAGDEIKKVAPEEVKVGDVIVVYAGEKISLDGVIVEGKTSLDTSALTGESLPRDVGVGDDVLAGTICLSETIYVKVTKTFENTSVSKIIELVEHSEDKKAKSENFITKFAKIYTPTVVGLALLLAIIPPLAFNLAWKDWIYRALTFLVVSCPCALVISIPLTFFAGIGGASKVGILIKGANYIETLSKVQTVGFDKTGTLTKGNFKVTNVHAINGNELNLVKLAALAETGMSHPVAKSIISYAETKTKLNPKSVKDQVALAGLGVSATINKKTVLVGNKELLKSRNIEFEESDKTGSTIIYVAAEKYLGYIEISDEIKPEAETLSTELKTLGDIKTVMLSGDREETAKTVAEKLSIDEYFGNLLPEHKAEKVEALKKNSTTAFVGDGINDAPVLKLADVGISMGKFGSDIAMESSDVVLMDDNPQKVVRAIKISKKTMRLVKENIIFTVGFKIVMLVLSALGIAPMWLGVFADVGVSLIAILNSLRALHTK